MSITWLPREMGLVVKCNGEGCTARFHSAVILATNVRAWLAKKEGWGRGSRVGTKTTLGTKRHDLCPSCLRLDRELAAKDAQAKEERKKQRDENRKAKLAAAALPKKSRRKKSDASPAPSLSPSADSALAPAT